MKQFIAIKLHKSEVPYKIKGEHVIQIHDVSPEDFDEEQGLGSYGIIAIAEL